MRIEMIETWQDWLKRQREAATMQVREVSVVEALGSASAACAWNETKEAAWQAYLAADSDDARKKSPAPSALCWVVCRGFGNLKLVGPWSSELIDNCHMKDLSNPAFVGSASSILLMDSTGTYRLTKQHDAATAEWAFFQGVGLQIEVAVREVRSWYQIALQETGVGMVGLLVDEHGNTLLRTKASPGNSPDDKYVLICAPLSASTSNLQGAHGGAATPFAELAGRENDVVVQSLQGVDGDRFFGKRERYTVVRMKRADANALCKPTDRWFTPAELSEAMRSGCTNHHLLIAYGLASAAGVFNNAPAAA
jgi:hypothetical protein